MQEKKILRTPAWFISLLSTPYNCIFYKYNFGCTCILSSFFLPLLDEGFNEYITHPVSGEGLFVGFVNILAQLIMLYPSRLFLF